MFMPEEALTAPMRSFPSTWVEYFKARCQNEYSMRRHLPQEFFPVSTFLLSQVNTILYGMYLHDKDHFTNLHLVWPSVQPDEITQWSGLQTFIIPFLINGPHPAPRLLARDLLLVVGKRFHLSEMTTLCMKVLSRLKDRVSVQPSTQCIV